MFIYAIVFIISSCNYITDNHFVKSWFTLSYDSSFCANLKIGIFSEMPCTLPFECYLQYLKLGVVNDKYHHHHQHHWLVLLFEHGNRIKRWCNKWGCECLAIWSSLASFTTNHAKCCHLSKQLGSVHISIIVAIQKENWVWIYYNA